MSACLDSILEQSYPSIKVAIVDDHSTDDSRNILDRYGAKHSNFLIGGFNSQKGVAKARNTAISMLDCEWISILDSDDFYTHRDKIMAEMRLVQAATSKQTAAFSALANVNRMGRPIKKYLRAPPLREGYLFEDILSRDCFAPYNFVFARAAFDSVGGFDEGLPIYEDWDFKIRLSREVEFRYSGLEGIAYRQTGSGLSSAPFADHVKWLRLIFERYVDLAEDPGALRPTFEKNIRPGLAVRLLSKISKTLRH